MENMDMGIHGPEETVDMNVAVLREKVKEELQIKKKFTLEQAMKA
jgi:hypothetical protein